MKRPCLMFCFAVLVGFALVAGGMTSVYAQENDADEFQLEEIIVTSQKRAENPQKVAIAMEVVAGEDLVGTGMDNVDDILKDISSVIVGKNEDGMRIAIRGLVDDDPIFEGMHTSNPTVAVNIDGAYNSSSSAGQNLFDLERVEVLAGPQSTLYGSNSPGGVVNVVTASPKTDKFSGNVSAEVGSYGLFDGQFMLNAPIIQDILAMRLAGQWHQRDGWMEGEDNHQDTKTVRLKTRYEPSDTFNATVTLNYSKAASGGQLAGMAKLFDYQDGHYGDGTPVTNPWLSHWINEEEETEPDPMSSDRETKAIQAEINWDTAIGYIAFVPYANKSESDDFRSDTEYTIRNDPNTYYTSMYINNYAEQKGADLRVTSPEDFPFRWIVGGTWFDAENANLQYDLDFPIRDYTATYTQTNKALYANITYPFADTFRGTVGYRKSWDDVKMVEMPGKQGMPSAEGSWVGGQTYSAPDYKVGIEYDLSEDSMFWANYASSYRLDPHNALDSDPQTLDAYSVGAKNRFFDNSLQLNVTAYYYEYKNKWFRGGGVSDLDTGQPFRETDYPHEDPDTGEWIEGTDFNLDGDYNDTTLPRGDPDLLPGETSDLYRYILGDPDQKNFGDMESLGVDLSVDWVPTGKDRVNLSVSYMDAEWSEAVETYYWSWIWEDHGLDHSGRKATFTPEWTVNVSYEHRFDLGSIGSLIPQFDAQYKSEYILAFEQSENNMRQPGGTGIIGNAFWRRPWIVQEPHYLLNASVTFNHASDRWSARAYVKNITDYAAKNFWGGHWDIYLGVSDPRVFGAVISYKF